MAQTTIKIEDRAHQRTLDRMMGIALVHEALEDHMEEFGKMPGYNSAKILIQGILAECRVEMASKNLRLATSKGVDISTHLVGYRGGDEILVDPMEEMGSEDAPEEPEDEQKGS